MGAANYFHYLLFSFIVIFMNILFIYYNFYYFTMWGRHVPRSSTFGWEKKLFLDFPATSGRRGGGFSHI